MDFASASEAVTMTGALIVRAIEPISADLGAVALEDVVLVPEPLEPEREPVGHVGELRRDPQRALLAAADQDRRAAAGPVEGTLSARSIW